MPRRLWRRVLSIAIVSAAGAASAWIWLRYDFEKVSWTWGVIGGCFGAFVVIYQILRDRDAVLGAPAAQRRVVAERLAELVWRNPADEALLRTLEEPYPLPVTWVNAPEEYQPSWRTICRSSDGRPLDLAGRDDGIRDCFARIPSGRLLVLGPAGSGKSIMSLRLARHLATDRTPDAPIPILLSIASWDPDAGDFHGWVTSQIANRYPQLPMAYPRWAAAVQDLLDANLILPILDGLDEATEERAARCLEQLNRLPTQRLLLTCRTGFYGRYLQRGEKLRGAAVILIEPLRPAKVADYLADAAPFHQAARWSPVVDEIANGGESELTAALSTPLMVAMARTAFDERDGEVPVDEVEEADPRILVTLAREEGRQSVEDRLLDGAVEAAINSAYGGRLSTGWRPAEARRYLSFLAGHLETHRRGEFVWWQLPAEVPGLFWVLFDGLRAALAVWVALALADGALLASADAAENAGVRELLRLVTEHRGWLTLVAVVIEVVGSTRGGRETHRGVPPARIVYRGGLRSFGRGILDGLVGGVAWGGACWLVLFVFEPAQRTVAFLDRYALPVTSWPDDARVAVTAGLLRLAFVAVRAGLRIDFAGRADQFAVTSPVRVIRADRAAIVLSLVPRVLNAVVFTLVLFGVLSLAGVLVAAPSLRDQVVAGAGLGLGRWISAVSGGAWIRFGVARFLLAVRGRVPHHLLRFLAAVDAVGLLRDLGGSYRFRHERLRNRLVTLGQWPRNVAQREEFATELARVGYWDEALADFGAVLTDRAATAGSDELMAAALRKTVLVGCAAGRWRRTEKRLSAVVASFPVPDGVRPDAVTAKRGEVSELLHQDAAPERLLAACAELIEAERAAGSVEPATLEFRATLLFVQGDRDAARAQLDALREIGLGEDRAHCTPVGAALLTRDALDDGDVDEAMALCREELLATRISPWTADTSRLAEAWWWSVRTMVRNLDELGEQRERLRDAARARKGTGWRDLRPSVRDLVELALLGCHRYMTNPWLSGYALAVARVLVDTVDNPESFLLTCRRGAPMWSDGGLGSRAEHVDPAVLDEARLERGPHPEPASSPG